MNHNDPLHFATIHHRAKGFTLTEVLVALIIIAIGALGIAKMQALALSSTGASRSRALAAIEASSLAAAMHANRAYWQNSSSSPGNIGVTTSVVSSGQTSTLTSDQATMEAAITNVSASSQWCSKTTTMPATLSCYCAKVNANTCSAASVNMAANDLYDWSSGLASLLPSSTAKVTCNNADIPVDCTIAITWTENAVSINQQEATAASANANTAQSNTAAFQYVTYSLYVVP
jgi:type IV pilus assembly protein PilV